MSTERDGKAVEASSSPKLEVPRFSSYQPVASGSSSSRHHHSNERASSDHHKHERRRHRRRSGDSKHVKSEIEESHSSRKERGGDSKTQHSESSRRHQSHGTSERSSRSSRSHRHRSRSLDIQKQRPSDHTGSCRSAEPREHDEDDPPPTFDRDLFYTDTRGDKDALVYGQDPSKVPKAHRARSQAALGNFSRDATTTIAVSDLHEPPDHPTASKPPDYSTETEEFISIQAPYDDPFDPSLPYVKRDSRFEQVGGGPISQPEVSASSTTSTLSPLSSRFGTENPTGIQVNPAFESSILSLLSSNSQKIRPIGIQDLPVETLHRILVLSRSSSLPLTCHHFRQACSNASISDKVDYVMGRWIDHYLSYLSSKRSCSHKHKNCRSRYIHIATLSHFRLLWSDFAGEIKLPMCGAEADEGLDVISFATQLGICTPAVLERVISAARASDLDSSFYDDPEGSLCAVPVPLLPKRLFRRIESFDYATLHPSIPETQRSETKRQLEKQQDASSSSQDCPKKRSRRHGVEKIANTGTADDETSFAYTNDSALVKQTDAPDTVQSNNAAFPVWLITLPRSLAFEPSKPVVDAKPIGSGKRKDLGDDKDIKKFKASVGPVPNADDLHLILILLYQYGADASSHQGYPLAMAVHRGAYSLVHLLLLFGADPRCKDGLAGQIAIRNGSLDVLRLLVSGPCLDADAVTSLPIPAGPTKPDRMGSRLFKLDQSHLRLAIQSKQWELVDYIWHEQQVSPDIACLRLIEKLRQ